MRYTRSFPDQNSFNPQAAVISQEAIKGLTCFYILFRNKEVRESYSNLVETLKVAVPALLYLYQNNAQYYASGNLNAATYTISYQSKTIWAALLSIVILGRWMILRKWIALLILAIGIIQVQLSGILEGKGGQNVSTQKDETYGGLVAIFSAAIASALAGVYFEFTLKGAKISIWARNLQLAFFSLILAFGPYLSTEFDFNLGFFYGFTLMTWACVLMNAFGGLLVGLVIKYADAVTKDVALGSSIVLSSIVSVYLFELAINVKFVFGALFVILGVVIYGGSYEKIADFLKEEQENRLFSYSKLEMTDVSNDTEAPASKV